jgi:hypothetical protein
MIVFRRGVTIQVFPLASSRFLGRVCWIAHSQRIALLGMTRKTVLRAHSQDREKQARHTSRLGQSESEAEAIGSGGLTINQSPGYSTLVP